MHHDTLISADELAQALAAPGAARLLVLDCSFDLTDAEAGERSHAAAHVPGATYIHLDRELSGAKTGRNGRHPLPDRETFAGAMAALGADDATQVVAYDNAAGMYAARLWWLLRWAGHGATAVLDGGLAAWRGAGLPVTDKLSAPRAAGRFTLRPALVSTADFDDVRANIGSGQRLVLDARAADRFRGENETLDPIGGHIPGARNRFFRDNLGPEGRFKSPSQLRGEYEALLGGYAATAVINQCGSGVTACHNLLAQAVAGLGGAALYPGSWSEWSAQPGAPIATGAAG